MFAAALVLFLASGPAPAGAADLPLPTVRFDTARFRVVASARAEAPARALAPTLEALRDEVSASLGRDWPGRTEVRVGLGREEYEALAVPGSRPPGWAVALAWPALNVVLVDARTIASPEGLTTLRHELVHVALGRLGADWPRWFQEGVAQMVTNERQFRTE
ncbi:MAG: hypothetical protein INH37_21215, partial [Myxococcaceae bacterium]|nr:hypothetical protein [Myxococcaceae bacterium]